MNLFLCYPKCSTCQKAKQFLEEHHIPFTERNIKEQNPTKEELKKWIDLSGEPPKKFFNTSGLVYKSLNLKEKLPTLSEEEQLSYLASDGMLVKSPLLITSKRVYIGFKGYEDFL